MVLVEQVRISIWARNRLHTFPERKDGLEFVEAHGLPGLVAPKVFLY